MSNMNVVFQVSYGAKSELIKNLESIVDDLIMLRSETQPIGRLKNQIDKVRLLEADNQIFRKRIFEAVNQHCPSSQGDYADGYNDALTWIKEIINA